MCVEPNAFLKVVLSPWDNRMCMVGGREIIIAVVMLSNQRNYHICKKVIIA